MKGKLEKIIKKKRKKIIKTITGARPQTIQSKRKQSRNEESGLWLDVFQILSQRSDIAILYTLCTKPFNTSGPAKRALA